MLHGPYNVKFNNSYVLNILQTMGYYILFHAEEKIYIVL